MSTTVTIHTIATGPYAQGVTAEICGADQRPKQLETMIQEAKSLAGK